MTRVEVVVIGAGPGGLAVAAALKGHGRNPLVVDRADRVGSSWRRHYDRLHLHTPRRWSGLPGYPIPRSFGRWVARDDVVRYLEAYAAHHRLELRLGSGVTRIDAVAPSTDGARWAVRLDDGSTVTADHVVVATGYNHTPVEPDWPGLDGFDGEVVLARDYRNGRPYAGRDVLVVGSGNTGMEIATDLADHGATRVWLAVRTPPHILPRSRLGWPAQGTGILVRRLPPRLVDRVAKVLAVVQEPDLTEFGMPRAGTDLYSRVLVGRVPGAGRRHRRRDPRPARRARRRGAVGRGRRGRARRRLPRAARRSSWSPPATGPGSSRSSGTSTCSTAAACRSCTAPTSPTAHRACGSPATPTRSPGCCASCASTPSGSPRRSAGKALGLEREAVRPQPVDEGGTQRGRGREHAGGIRQSVTVLDEAERRLPEHHGGAAVAGVVRGRPRWCGSGRRWSPAR